MSGSFAKLVDDAVALLGRDLAVVFQRSESARAARCSVVSVCDPLAEDDRLLAAGRDFFQIGFQPFQLAAGAGGRIEVADLFQPQDQFEDVLDREFVRPCLPAATTPSSSAVW